VLAARTSGSSLAREALEQLCRAYWYPLYAFVRRRGVGPHEAEDLTQAFFAHLLETEALKTVAREKGRFRSFLLSALTNFLNNEWDKQRTLKRGGQCQLISWDDVQAEELYRREPVDRVTPERLFERRWAVTMVDQVLSRLKQEYRTKGKLDLFEMLQPHLTQEATPGFYAAAAARLTMTDGAVKVALHRLRRRFGELLRSQIAHTVASPEQVDEEIRYLFAVIAS
jgi:RNA polymerase sigma-70 factor (ECF subfamily)